MVQCTGDEAEVHMQRATTVDVKPLGDITAGMLAGMRSWQSLAVLLGLSLATAASAQSALQLYRSGDYERACPLFEGETRRRPQDGAAWADWALCEEKRGRLEKARHANMLAVRWGNEQTRKNAYFNLWRMKEGVDLSPFYSLGDSANGSRKCLALRAAPELACAAEVRACAYGRRGLGARGEGHNIYVKLEPCEGSCALQLRPPEFAESEHRDVEAERSFEGNRILLSRNIPDSRCEQFEGGQMCGLVPGDEQECTIVSVDPCSRRVGYVCFDGYEEHTDRASTPLKPRAEEKLLMSVGCPEEPSGKRESVCNEARLKQVEQEARELGKEERFECVRKRLEELEQACGATFSGSQRTRLMMLRAGNAFRRGDFTECRVLLRDVRPSDASRLVEWAESMGRCGGDCSGGGLTTHCSAGLAVYRQLTEGEPEPCEIAGHSTAWRVWNSGAPEVIQSCLEWDWPSGPPAKGGKRAMPCPRLRLVQQRQDGALSTRLLQSSWGKPPGTTEACCKVPTLSVEPYADGATITITSRQENNCPARAWGAKFSWNGGQLSPVKESMGAGRNR